jgi:hypothetical protein
VCGSVKPITPRLRGSGLVLSLFGFVDHLAHPLPAAKPQRLGFLIGRHAHLQDWRLASALQALAALAALGWRPFGLRGSSHQLRERVAVVSAPYALLNALGVSFAHAGAERYFPQAVCRLTHHSDDFGRVL